MAGNVFDQFDATPSTAPAAGGPNIFDQFDDSPPPQAAPRYPNGALSNADNDSFFGSQGKLAATAGIEGATSSVTGGGLEYLADLGLSGAESLARSAGHYFNHAIEQKSPDQIYQELQQQKAAMEQKFAQRRGFALPQTGQEAAENLQKGIFSKTGAYEPTNPVERYEIAGLAGAAGMVAPGPGLPGSAAVPKAAIAAIPRGGALFGATGAENLPAAVAGARGTAIGAMPAGAIGATAAQATQDITGSPLAGVVAGALVPGAAGWAMNRTGLPQAVEANLTPKLAAGKRLLASASDPEAVKQWAAAVPQGSEPQGHPQDLADFVTNQFRDLDNHTQAIADQASALNANAQDAARGPGMLPEAQGNAQRTLLAAQREAATTEENRLWGIVDPNGTLVSDMTPIKQAGVKAYDNLPTAAEATLTPAERTFRDLAAQYPDAAPFSELQAFKSALGEAIRNERFNNGKTQALRRLTMLQDGVYNSINGTIVGKVAQDNAAVAAGQMAPEATLGASLANDAQQFIASRSANLRAGNVGAAGSRSPAMPGVSGANAPQGFQSAPNSPGISEQALSPNFSEADRQALAAARASTQARAQTFDQGPVGKILAPGQNANTYKLSDSLVPQKIFVAGPPGGDAIDAYRAAAGNSPQAEQSLRDTISDALTAKTLNSDGNVDPIKLAKFQQDYGPAFSRMDPAFTQNFQNAASATESLGRIQQARKTALDTYQKSAFGRLIGADPTTTERVVGGMFGAKTAVRDFRQLAQEAAKDQTGTATQGLRRTVLDHIDTKFLTGNKAVAFQKFMRQNDGALRQVFEPAHVDMLHALSNALARRDILPYLKQASEGGHGSLSMLGMIGLAKEALGPVLETVHGVPGAGMAIKSVAGGVIGKKLINAMQRRGMSKVVDLLKEGVSSPDVGRALIMRASKVADQGSQHALTTALRRAMVSAQAIRGGYASGGPVDPMPVEGNEQENEMAPGASAEAETGDMGVQSWHPMLIPPPKTASPLGGAAVRVNGQVFTGSTHAGAILAAEDKFGPSAYDKAEEGFTTNDGSFVNREQATQMQYGSRTGPNNGYVGSENLPPQQPNQFEAPSIRQNIAAEESSIRQYTSAASRGLVNQDVATRRIAESQKNITTMRNQLQQLQ